jgi:hypothetical protein
MSDSEIEELTEVYELQSIMRVRGIAIAVGHEEVVAVDEAKKEVIARKFTR